MQFFPGLGWANAVANSNAVVNLSILGETLHFSGTGYHDKVSKQIFELSMYLTTLDRQMAAEKKSNRTGEISHLLSRWVLGTGAEQL